MSRDRPEFTDFDDRFVRDRSPKRPSEQGGRPMTVCIAALFSFNYAPPGEQPNFKWVAITASDQMITAGDSQYQPSQQKVAYLTPKTLCLVAGDVSTHSEAISFAEKQLQGRPNESPYNIALIYGQAIQRIRRRNAEDRILAPLGLNTDTFLSQQKEMSDYFANDLKEQLQRFQGQDVEALIVGTDGEYAHIYEVDARGSVSCMDDIAFHAIGAGAWHVKSALMQSGYARTNSFANAMAQVYSAKRRAEIAPGVGERTDFHLVFREGPVRLDADIEAKLGSLYEEFRAQQAKMAAESIEKLREFLHDRTKKDGAGTDGNEADHGKAVELATQATQGDDGEEKARAIHAASQENGAA